MRVVVADTGPIHYLILIGHSDILPVLFQNIIIPSVVRNELLHQEAPILVRNWMAQPPTWIDVREAPARRNTDASMAKLDAGERDVIGLASLLGADLLLMDDRRGVMAARNKGFAVTGTLGVLELAAERKHLNLRDVLLQLRDTSFRCRPEILDAMLTRHRGEAG